MAAMIVSFPTPLGPEMMTRRDPVCAAGPLLAAPPTPGAMALRAGAAAASAGAPESVRRSSVIGSLLGREAGRLRPDDPSRPSGDARGQPRGDPEAARLRE